MTQEQFHDLQQLGLSITKCCRAMENFRAVIESRESIAKAFRVKYPNMKIEAIREQIWEQEESLSKAAQVEFDAVRMNAYSLGWNFDHKDIEEEVKGIMRKNLVLLKDINV